MDESVKVAARRKNPGTWPEMPGLGPFERDALIGGLEDLMVQTADLIAKKSQAETGSCTSRPTLPILVGVLEGWAINDTGLVPRLNAEPGMMVDFLASMAGDMGLLVYAQQMYVVMKEARAKRPERDRPFGAIVLADAPLNIESNDGAFSRRVIILHLIMERHTCYGILAVEPGEKAVAQWSAPILVDFPPLEVEAFEALVCAQRHLDERAAESWVSH